MGDIVYRRILDKRKTYDFEGDDAISGIISNNGNGYITIGTTYELPGQVVAEIRNMFIIKTNDECLVSIT